MRLYITAAGVYAGTQVEAKRDGKGWHEEIVPTDKTGLIDYLNKLKHGDCVDMVEAQQVDRPTRAEPALAAPYGASDNYDADPEAQPNTFQGLEPRMPTEAGRLKLRAGREADQIAEYILDDATPAFAVSHILGAAMERVERLTRLLD